MVTKVAILFKTEYHTKPILYGSEIKHVTAKAGYHVKLILRILTYWHRKKLYAGLPAELSKLGCRPAQLSMC
jgi:hypothetical protein